MAYQFPVAATLFRWGILPNDDCRLCKKVNPEKTPGKETLGHIHGYCPALKLIRIAVHHGIWRQILTGIQKHSTETYAHSEIKKWHFSSAVSEVSHIEWDLKEMLIHMKVMTNDCEGRIQLKIDILQFHESELHEDFFTDKNGVENVNHDKLLMLLFITLRNNLVALLETLYT